MSSENEKPLPKTKDFEDFVKNRPVQLTLFELFSAEAIENEKSRRKTKSSVEFSSYL